MVCNDPLAVAVGLDLSLTATGIVNLNNFIPEHDGGPLSTYLIKSKKCGDSYREDTQRIIDLAAEILTKAQTGISYSFPKEVIFVIEGMGFSMIRNNSIAKIAGLSYFVRAGLQESKHSYVICPPATLKKFVTGKGNAKKDDMKLQTYKRWGEEFTDDNLCDAYGLAQIGLALLGKPSKPLTEPQKDVIKLLNKQL